MMLIHFRHAAELEQFEVLVPFWLPEHFDLDRVFCFAYERESEIACGDDEHSFVQRFSFIFQIVQTSCGSGLSAKTERSTTKLFEARKVNVLHEHTSTATWGIYHALRQKPLTVLSRDTFDNAEGNGNFKTKGVGSSIDKGDLGATAASVAYRMNGVRVSTTIFNWGVIFDGEGGSFDVGGALGDVG